MSRLNLWTEEEVTLALLLYLSRPFGQLRSPHPDVVRLASLIGRTPGAVSRKIGNLGFCDDSLKAQGISGLANGAKVDKLVWEHYVGSRRGELPLEPLLEDAAHIARAQDINIDFLFDANGPNVPATASTSLVGQERFVFRKERVYQNFFRNMVLAGYDGRCAISGLRLPMLIEAAHIVPWANRKDVRLLPSNGIALNPLLHRAYDAHLLGVDGKRRVHVSQTLRRAAADTRMESFFETIDGSTLQSSRHFSPSTDLLEERFEEYMQTQGSHDPKFSSLVSSVNL